MTGKTRIVVEIDEDVAKALEELASDDNGNIASAITRAVVTRKYLKDNADGDKVLIKKEGTLREVEI